MKGVVYNQEGKNLEDINLPEEIFSKETNFDLLSQVVNYYESLQRQKIAKVKDRSEKRGGGRKPWRQKGTGRARHGSIRSPIWKGGGVTFGPNPEKKFDKKISKKMKQGALSMVFSQKLKDDEIILIDEIKIQNSKTKEIKNLIKNLSKIKKEIERDRIIFILKEKNNDFERAIRNVRKASCIDCKSVNSYTLLRNKYLVIEKSVFSVKEEGKPRKKISDAEKKNDLKEEKTRRSQRKKEKKDKRND